MHGAREGESSRRKVEKCIRPSNSRHPCENGAIEPCSRSAALKRNPARSSFRRDEILARLTTSFHFQGEQRRIERRRIVLDRRHRHHQQQQHQLFFLSSFSSDSSSARDAVGEISPSHSRGNEEGTAMGENSFPKGASRYDVRIVEREGGDEKADRVREVA